MQPFGWIAVHPMDLSRYMDLSWYMDLSRSEEDRLLGSGLLSCPKRASRTSFEPVSHLTFVSLTGALSCVPSELSPGCASPTRNGIFGFCDRAAST